ncbi:PREDICTED: apolipoprotein L6 [Galeopterus variegatus]|uniref:Apolipoprotein L6 n=1 Tax=Galeopterus variegatus TaxID=482537 RepID=A0ABM0S6E5_GALVR|nr:PREDICTED: apolipoprotein L6 [Galeopterus variegatus]
MDLVPQRLLDNQAAKEREASVGLQRDEDDISLCEDAELPDGDLSAEEKIFLEEFPRLKQDLEVNIRKLRALADHMDTIHKTFTKTNIVANSVTVFSGVMSVLGLALAPVTAGGSLVLSAAGQSLGTAAGVTSIMTSAWEHFHNKKARAQASSLVPTLDQEVRVAGGKEASYVMAASQIAYNCGSTIRDVKKNIRAFRTARAHPHLAKAAKRLLTTGQVSARRSRQVQKAFEGTTLVMTKNARMLGGAMATFSLGQDLAALWKDWKQLQEGARTESAEELRSQAGKLERKLAKLTQLHENLQQKKKGHVRKAMQEGSCLHGGKRALTRNRMEELPFIG